MRPEDDTDLLRAFRAGDREAFAELIHRHRTRVLHLATAVLARDDAAAEDVTQEASYQAYFEIGHLREPARFEAWI
jgi:DNA-directed RNA polymerase specialized sigma24 family protein